MHPVRGLVYVCPYGCPLQNRHTVMRITAQPAKNQPKRKQPGLQPRRLFPRFWSGLLARPLKSGRLEFGS